MKCKRTVFLTAVVVAMVLLLGVSTAQAAVILNAIETTEGGVLISGGGTLNLDAWEGESFDQYVTASVAPATGGVFVGGTAGALFFIAQYTNPSDFQGPDSFGDGTEQTADRTTGDDFPFGIDPSVPSLSLDPSYFGFPLEGEAKYDNTTLEELGMEPGTYVWTWGSGETADSFTLNVGTENAGNLPPNAEAGGSYRGRVGDPITFDGSASSDPDGTIESYEWNFGDDQRGEGPNPAHTYAAPGTYFVTLTVTDDDDVPDSKTTTAIIIAIDESQPVAEAGGPYFGTTGAAVSFDGTGSNPQDGTETYEWNFGDGWSGRGPTPSHTYRESGLYIVTLKVTTEGRRFDMDATTASIGVGNLPPKARTDGPYTGRVGEEIIFDGSASRDPDGTIERYEWRFGEGDPPSPAPPPGMVRHTYSEPGLYNVILTVTDNDDLKDSIKTIAVISPGPLELGDEIAIERVKDSTFFWSTVVTVSPFVTEITGRYHDIDFDPGVPQIDVLFNEAGVFSQADFNGFRFWDKDNAIADFEDVSIWSSNIPGFDESRITFNGNNIYMNFEALAFDAGDSVSLRIRN